MIKFKPMLFLLFLAFINLKAEETDSIELNLLKEEVPVKEFIQEDKIKYSTIEEIENIDDSKWNQIYDMKIEMKGFSKPSFIHFKDMKELVKYERTSVKKDLNCIKYKIYTERKYKSIIKESRSKEVNFSIMNAEEPLISRFQLMLNYEFNKNPFYMDFESYKEIQEYIKKQNIKNDIRLKVLKIFIKKEKTGLKDVKVYEYNRTVSDEIEKN